MVSVPSESEGQRRLRRLAEDDPFRTEAEPDAFSQAVDEGRGFPLERQRTTPRTGSRAETALSERDESDRALAEELRRRAAELRAQSEGKSGILAGADRAEAQALEVRAANIEQGLSTDPFTSFQRDIIEPGAGVLTAGVQSLIPGEQEIEGRTAELREEGVGPIEAARQSFVASDLPSTRVDVTPGFEIPLPGDRKLDEVDIGVKGLAEGAADPLNVLPVIGFGGDIARGAGAAVRTAGRGAGEAAQQAGQAVRRLRRVTPEDQAAMTPEGAPLREVQATGIEPSPGATRDVPAGRSLDESEFGPVAGEAPTPPGTEVAAPPSPPQPPAPRASIVPSNPQELIDRFVAAIPEAKVAREVTEREVSQELGKRAARARRALARGDRRGARAAFQGEHPKTGDIAPVADAFSPEEGAALRNLIVQRFGPTQTDEPFKWIQADTAFTKLFDEGQIPTASELAVLEEVFGEAFVRSIRDMRSRSSKAWELFREVFNIPRAMLATGEISATLRQGATRAFDPETGHIFRDATKAQLRAFGSEDASKAVAEEIGSSQWFESSQRAGLDLTLPSSVKTPSGRLPTELAQREEPFIGARLLEKEIRVPVGRDRTVNVNILGEIVKASERAYVTYLNKVRFDTFVHEAEKLGENVTAAELRDIAKGINILTGRANLGKFTEASQVLSGVFFAPRWSVSRFQVPLTVMRGRPAARKMAARGLVSYTTTVTTMLALADIANVANVDWNPLSSDFLKARFGNTRIDPWAGLQQPAVLVARLASGKTRTLSTREIQDISAPDAIKRFVESKLHPSMRFLLNRGEGFAGEPPLEESPIPKIPNAIFDNFVFLFVQDMAEAIEEHGAAGAAVGPAAAVGVGSQTFGDDFETATRDTFNAFRELPKVEKFDLRLGQVGPTLDLDVGQTGGSVELTTQERAEYQRIMADMVAAGMQQVLPHIDALAISDEEKQEFAESELQKLKNEARKQYRDMLNRRRLQQPTNQDAPATSPQPTETPTPTPRRLRRVE